MVIHTKMTNLKFSIQSYCKMILHAVKYPHCSVNGILLSKTSSLSSNKEIEIVDTIPLFHISINLTPMAEIALMQIDEYAANNGLSIVGYYVAPDNIREGNFDKVCHRIIERIVSNNGSSYVVIVNSTNNTIQAGRIALKVAQYCDGSYKLCEQIAVSDYAINACINLMQDGFYKELVDFDNHLDNLSLDWTNNKFNKELELDN